MWTCANGHENPEGQAFCGTCGETKPNPASDIAYLRDMVATLNERIDTLLTQVEERGAQAANAAILAHIDAGDAHGLTVKVNVDNLSAAHGQETPTGQRPSLTDQVFAWFKAH